MIDEESLLGALLTLLHSLAHQIEVLVDGTQGLGVDATLRLMGGCCRQPIQRLDLLHISSLFYLIGRVQVIAARLLPLDYINPNSSGGPYRGLLRESKEFWHS